MKKTLYLLIVSLFLVNYCCGQTKQDSINSYQKVNKWAVVKLTIAYMEDLKNWPKNKNNIKNKESETYDKLKTKYDLYVENINLEEVNSLLLEGWEKTRDSIFQRYKKELVDSQVTSYNFEKIYFVPEKVRDSNRSKAIKTIQDQFTKLLNTLDNEIEEITSVNTESGQTIKKSKESLSLFSIAVYLVLGISVLLNFYLCLKLSKTHKKNQKSKKSLKSKTHTHYNNIVIEGNVKELESQILVLKSDLRKLESKNLELTTKLGSHIDKIPSDIQLNLTDENKSLPIDLKETTTQQAKTKFLYFPSPFAENRFANEDASETEMPISLYVAEIEKNTNSGRISLLETADLSRALNSPNTFLETVCSFENAYSAAAKEIKVIEDGEVMLIGEDWVVKSKIKIKFN